MTPRTFTEVALKILGIYSLVESVIAISQGISFYGLIGVFSKIESSIFHVLPAIILLIFGWMLLQFSKKTSSSIFDRGAPLPPSPNRLYREWHISLLSLCGGFLTVWGIPILLSGTSNSLSLLFLESSRTQGWTRDSLLTQLVCKGVFIILEIGIFMCLFILAKPLTNAILKFQDSKLT